MTSLLIEKPQRGHAIDTFDCGPEALNRFPIRFAFQNQQAEASQTYVALAEAEIVGYYTLVVGQVDDDDAFERLTKVLAQYPVPIMLLARLAIANLWQGKGLGAGPPKKRDAAYTSGCGNCRYTRVCGSREGRRSQGLP